MEQKEQQASYGSKSAKGVYAFLITAIIALLLVLIYLVGIMFFPSFAKMALNIPGLSVVTNALVGSMYTKPEVVQTVSGDSKKPEAVTTEKAQKAQEKEEPMVILEEEPGWDETYFNHCVFLGDSRTVAMSGYGYVPEDSTLAQVGLSHMSAESTIYTFSSGLQYNFKDYVMTHQADVIYISYGVNGMNYSVEEQYKSAYRKLVEDVMFYAPGSDIVIQSIWPVREGYAMTGQIDNNMIDYYNEFLLELAEEKGIYYLDTQSVLKDEYNTMKAEYNSGDGLHYSEAGYEAAMGYLLSHPVPDVE